MAFTRELWFRRESGTVAAWPPAMPQEGFQGRLPLLQASFQCFSSNLFFAAVFRVQLSCSLQWGQVPISIFALVQGWTIFTREDWPWRVYNCTAWNARVQVLKWICFLVRTSTDFGCFPQTESWAAEQAERGPGFWGRNETPVHHFQTGDWGAHVPG